MNESKEQLVAVQRDLKEKEQQLLTLSEERILWAEQTRQFEEAVSQVEGQVADMRKVYYSPFDNL